MIVKKAEVVIMLIAELGVQILLPNQILLWLRKLCIILYSCSVLFNMVFWLDYYKSTQLLGHSF